jgi:hypothetical protein
MTDETKVLHQFDWDKAREQILDASIAALERLTDKVTTLCERADQAARPGAGEADVKAEDERLVRETGKLLIQTIAHWRDACIERNKAKGILREYAFDLTAAEKEVGRRLAALKRAQTAGAVSD